MGKHVITSLKKKKKELHKGLEGNSQKGKLNRTVGFNAPHTHRLQTVIYWNIGLEILHISHKNEKIFWQDTTEHIDQ